MHSGYVEEGGKLLTTSGGKHPELYNQTDQLLSQPLTSSVTGPL